MMPAGRYYVGDLCYVMNDDEWNEICGLTFKGGKVTNGEFTLNDGRKFAMYSTAYGDGEYYSNIGHSLSVDSGTIGCILEQDIKTEKYENLLDLGSIVDISNDFETDEYDGIIQFGFLKIDTAPVFDEDY